MNFRGFHPLHIPQEFMLYVITLTLFHCCTKLFFATLLSVDLEKRLESVQVANEIYQDEMRELKRKLHDYSGNKCEKCSKPSSE